MTAKLELKEVREPSVVKSLVRAILNSPHKLVWSVQGLGMLRLYLDDHRRMHIWDSSLRVDNVSDMHTHPWNFRSHVVVGEVRNQRYVIHEAQGSEYNKQTIFCGAGGGLIGSSEKVMIEPYGSYEIYTERETYSELAHEIHVSFPEDGTITIVNREFLNDADHALVFWKEGEWISAEPRIATFDEVLRVTQNSLNRWF